MIFSCFVLIFEAGDFEAESDESLSDESQPIAVAKRPSRRMYIGSTYLHLPESVLMEISQAFL